jgi:hypothetical protein
MTTPEPGKYYWAVEGTTEYQRPVFVKRVEFGMAYCTQFPGIPIELRVDWYDWQPRRDPADTLTDLMVEPPDRVVVSDVLQEVPADEVCELPELGFYLEAVNGPVYTSWPLDETPTSALYEEIKTDA